MTRQRRPPPLSLILASVGLVSLVERIHVRIALEFSLFQTSFYGAVDCFFVPIHSPCSQHSIPQCFCSVLFLFVLISPALESAHCC